MSGAESSKKGGRRGAKQQKVVIAAAVAAIRQDRNGSLRISEPGSNVPVVSSCLETPQEINEDLSNKQNNEKSKVIDKGKGKKHVEVELDSNAQVLSSGTESPNERNEDISKKEKSAKSKARSRQKRKEPVEVEFNERSQHVGEYAAEFSTFLGKTARGLVPLTVPSWYGNELDDKYKDQIWKHVTTHYILDECHQKVIFQKMAKLWRDHRSRTLSKIKQKVAEVGLQTAAINSKPSNVHVMEEWLKFIKSRMTTEHRIKSEVFKEKRSKKNLLHRTSRTSFACIEHDLKKSSDAPEKITRSDVWLRGYETKQKNDDDDVEDPEVVKQVKEKMADQASSSLTSSINDDAISQVLGPERRGRVRGFGFGAKPSQIHGQTYVGGRVARLEQELKGLKTLLQSVLGQDKREKSSENSNTQISPTQIRLSNDTSTSKKRKLVDEGVDQRARSATIRKLHLLNWFDEERTIVAVADLQSEDPKEKVHCVPLGHGCCKVWVHEVFDNIPLYRPTSEFSTLAGAIGSTIAWPTTCIKYL